MVSLDSIVPGLSRNMQDRESNQLARPYLPNAFSVKLLASVRDRSQATS
jgi:hypothetical protein